MRAAVIAVLLVGATMVAAQNCLTTDGLALIKGYEGFRAKQYKDSAGIWTIGYGTLCSTGTLKCPGPVTETAARAELGRAISANYGTCVRQYVKNAVNNNQYSALISFAYNAGCGALQNVVTATKGVVANFPARMVLYNKATVKGKLQVVQGLVNRRNAEVALFRKAAVSACATSTTGAILRSSAPTPGAVVPTAVPAAGAAAVPVAVPAVSPAVTQAQQAIQAAAQPFPVAPQPSFNAPVGLPPATHGRIVAEAEDTGKVNWVRDRKVGRKLKMGGLKKQRNGKGKKKF